MKIKKIVLNNFRTYDFCELELGPNINYIYGNNAMGKTNIIESIYIASITKSFRAEKYVQCVKFDKEYSRIECEYEKTKTEVFIQALENGIEKAKKVIKENGIIVSKLAEYIGKNPVVLFSPDDINITKAQPKARRKFIDVFISQIEKQYVYALSEYNKTILMKNNILKTEKIDNGYLDVLDEKISNNIYVIAQLREKYIKLLEEQANKIQYSISNNMEELKLKYVTEFEEKEINKIKEKLLKSRNIDKLKKVSSYGINHDDIEIYVNGKMVGLFGSQGQNKTAIISMKLAEFELLKKIKETEPLILLDDVFSELDDKRKKYLLEYVKKMQVIITSTQQPIISEFDKDSNIKIFKVFERGLVKNEK